MCSATSSSPSTPQPPSPTSTQLNDRPPLWWWRHTSTAETKTENEREGERNERERLEKERERRQNRGGGGALASGDEPPQAAESRWRGSGGTISATMRTTTVMVLFDETLGCWYVEDGDGGDYQVRILS
ncbi:hypothetical protein Hanom_Chr03g00198861 [Helianthus anomalus]